MVGARPESLFQPSASLTDLLVRRAGCSSCGGGGRGITTTKVEVGEDGVVATAVIVVAVVEEEMVDGRRWHEEGEGVGREGAVMWMGGSA